MDRRELFECIAGVAASAGVTARASVVEAVPTPALAVFETDDELTDDDAEGIDRMWRNVVEGTALAGCRVVVLGSGLRLTLLDANGRVCNQDLRTLPEGGA